jgi:hypothetical protein
MTTMMLMLLKIVMKVTTLMTRETVVVMVSRWCW